MGDPAFGLAPVVPAPPARVRRHPLLRPSKTPAPVLTRTDTLDVLRKRNAITDRLVAFTLGEAFNVPSSLGLDTKWTAGIALAKGAVRKEVAKTLWNWGAGTLQNFATDKARLSSDLHTLASAMAKDIGTELFRVCTETKDEALFAIISEAIYKAETTKDGMPFADNAEGRAERQALMDATWARVKAWRAAALSTREIEAVEMEAQRALRLMNAETDPKAWEVLHEKATAAVAKAEAAKKKGAQPIIDRFSTLFNTFVTLGLDYAAKRKPSEATAAALVAAFKYFDAHGLLDSVINGVANLAATAGLIPLEQKDDIARLAMDYSRAEAWARSQPGYESWQDRALRLDAHFAAHPVPKISEDRDAFAKRLEEESGARFTASNHVEWVAGGKPFGDKMKEMFEHAVGPLVMNYWAIYDDPFGKEVVEMIRRAKQQGVEIIMMVDGKTAATHGNDEVLPAIEALGVSLCRWSEEGGGVHQKNIVDLGRGCAMNGGSNPGKDYAMDGYWHDANVYAEGPVTREMAKDNVMTWNRAQALKLGWKKTTVRELLSRGGMSQAELDTLRTVNGISNWNAVADDREILSPAVPVQGWQMQGRFIDLDAYPMVGPSDGRKGVRAAYLTHTPFQDENILRALLTLNAGADEKTPLVIDHAYVVMTPVLESALRRVLENGVPITFITNSKDSLDEPALAYEIARAAKRVKEIAEELGRPNLVRVYEKQTAGKTLHDKASSCAGFSTVGSYNLHPRSETIERENALLTDEPPAPAGEKQVAKDIAAEMKRMIDAGEVKEVQKSSDIDVPVFDSMSFLLQLFINQA